SALGVGILTSHDLRNETIAGAKEAQAQLNGGRRRAEITRGALERGDRHIAMDDGIDGGTLSQVRLFGSEAVGDYKIGCWAACEDLIHRPGERVIIFTGLH